MLHRIRIATIGKLGTLALMGSVAFFTTGCFHDEGGGREGHAGWHERGSYGHDYDRHNSDRHDDNRDHDYR